MKSTVLSILAFVLFLPSAVQAFRSRSSTRPIDRHALFFRRRIVHHENDLIILRKNSQTVSRKTWVKPLSITSKDTDYGEDSRRFRRTYYNNESWLRHRSSDRLIRNFTSMISSGIFRQLLRDIGVVAIVSTLIVAWNCGLVVGFDDLTGHHHEPIINSPCLPLLELPRDPFILSSPALGLLLGK